MKPGRPRQHLNGQLAAVLHEDAGRLLVGVAAVFEQKFFHGLKHSSFFQVFVAQTLLEASGLKIGEAHKQRDLVVGV